METIDARIDRLASNVETLMGIVDRQQKAIQAILVELERARATHADHHVEVLDAIEDCASRACNCG